MKYRYATLVLCVTSIKYYFFLFETMQAIL